MSTTDPDAKLMQTGTTKGYIVGYNVQTAVDGKNCLIVNYDIKNNPTDQGLLYEMASNVKEQLGVEKLEVLADKAYYKEEDIIACEAEGITTYVKKPKVIPGNLAKEYFQDKFEYDEEKDVFICPAGQELKNHTKKIGAKRIKYYNYEACQKCKDRNECTESKQGRLIEMHPERKILDMVAKRLEENKEKYKRRQMIVEHPFGTIKRALGIEYFLLRGKKGVSGETGLVFYCYNLKRLMKLRGTQILLSE